MYKKAISCDFFITYRFFILYFFLNMLTSKGIIFYNIIQVVTREKKRKTMSIRL